MPEETTNTASTGAVADTSAGDGKNTAATAPVAGTQTAATEGAKGEAQTTAETKADAGKVFTQKEVEELVTQRLAQQKASAQTAAQLAAKAESERLLAEKGEFKTLAEQRGTELEQARAELRTERLNNAMLQEAAKVNVQNTTALMKLIKDDVEFDAEGKPSNLAKLVAQAIKDVPGLVAVQEQGTTKVELTPINTARTTQVANGNGSLFQEGLFKK